MNSRLRIRVGRVLGAAVVVAMFWYAVLHLAYTAGGY